MRAIPRSDQRRRAIPGSSQVVGLEFIAGWGVIGKAGRVAPRSGRTTLYTGALTLWPGGGADLGRRSLGALAAQPVLAQKQQDRSGDEYRGRRADDDAEQHDPGEAGDRLAAEQCERQAGEEDSHRGAKSTVEGLVDREVDQLAQGHGFVFTQVLADAVVNHDLVVGGIAENRQDGGDHHQIEFDAGDGEEPDGFGDVEHQCDHGTDGELPFEAEPDVDHDHRQADAERVKAVAEQFRGDRSADSVGAQKFHAGDGLFQRGTDAVHFLLDGGLRGLLPQADQDLGWIAEALHALLGDVVGREGGADLAEIGGARRSHLHHDAAGEVDALVQAWVEEQDDGGRGQDCGHDEAHVAASHELDLCAVADQAEGGAHEHGGYTGKSCGRRETYQRDTSRRVSIQAVKSDVAMPTVMVTAKPFTGPEPKTNSITWARKAVALESKIVL